MTMRMTLISPDFVVTRADVEAMPQTEVELYRIQTHIDFYASCYDFPQMLREMAREIAWNETQYAA